MENNDFLNNFDFKKDGQVAVIRFLHTSATTFETIKTHWLRHGSTYKHVKCIGEGCPACEKESAREELVMRIYDYTDSKIKVWAINNGAKSASNLIEKISSAVSEWGVGLNELAFKLTCHKNTATINEQVISYFTYDVDVVPTAKYPTPDAEIDVKYAIRTASKRSKEDMIQFMNTGVMPPKPAYNPNNNSATTTSTSASTSAPAVEVVSNDDDDLPF